ncbi:MAG: succinate dehydrogenase, hydrophobic membrane anchor protein [Hyphomicrobiales bacterium]|nr:succinate dehydrogenase, hydrophobic membrane anchor protein [Hyphomicrobiales bacterium]MCY4049153.1 succinate dehydrogenase, hydrophobic membrane anchor protein [Hyphomicrobiales bacterium]MCY4053557.1 succinate dehydrogenase, hydrophobic membrane anchor protein [Hyphomicrobiales bacterium]
MDKSTAHFLKQRLTALANIPLALFFLYALMTHAGADYETMRAFLSNPLVSAALLGFIVSALWHMYLGMQIIIEDYIHGEALKLFVLALNFLFCLSVGFVSVLSALRIWMA